ncbi:MAG: 3'-5' exonuclease, partial [Nanoarchaeota archaeon]
SFFQKKFLQTQIIILTKNYRSSQEIVQLINLSIKDHQLPDLEGISEQKNAIFFNRFDTEAEESNFIIEKITELDYKKNKIFVLTRTNKQANTIVALFKQKNIPSSIKKEDNLFSNKSGEVTISTIHAVKGLEADIVFVKGCTEQNFPCKYSDNPLANFLKTEEYDKEAEEKRLFYVALSRAKNILYLSYSGKKPTKFITLEMKSKLAYTDNSSQKELLYQNGKDILEKDSEQTQQEDTPLSYREDWEDMISD